MRFLDFLFSFLGIIIFFPIIFLIIVIIFLHSGSPLFLQKRVGKQMKPFIMVKFRTMTDGTASVATHLVDSSSVTFLGQVLRKTKLDELPQLWNVLKGDMSLVGPRPNLFNQVELIKQRQALGIYKVKPGITGLAQINNIDMSTPKLLAKTDAEMITSMSIAKYFKFIILTVTGKGQGDRIHL